MARLRDNLNLFARQFAMALQRATRLPAGAGFAAPAAPDEELLRTSARHLPGAGAVVGLLSAFVFAIIALLLRDNPAGPAVAAVASLFAVLLLTGAAHESALFRLAEAIGPRAAAGGPSGYGTIALVLLLAGRIATVTALGAVSEAGVLAALLAAPAVSRFAPLLAAHWAGHEPAADAGTVPVAALWCLLPLALMLLAGGVAFVVLALVGAAAAWIALLRFFRHRPGGFDDARAAALQLSCEVAFYLGSSVGV